MKWVCSMVRTHTLGVFGMAVAGAVIALGAQAQGGDPGAQIQAKLVSQIKLTKPTADHTDIVTAGDVVVLQKDGLMMCSSASTYAFSNTYSGGVLSANYNNRAKDAAKSFLKGRLPFGGGGSATDAANNGCASRKFVAGEKFWVTGVTPQKDGIVVATFSDPYQDPSNPGGDKVHFYGEIKFLYPKGVTPVPDDFVKTVSEVMTVAPADDSDKGGGAPAQAAAPAAPAPPPAPMAAIAPPPPPADAPPPTIAIGQTKDQVTTAFGQPTRMAKVGVKEIFYYKDMKVTFTNGKVSNVE
jgi:hypothetical protein